MMGVEMKKKKERSSPFGWYGMSQSSAATEKPNEFRVDADVEHNRLLLYANEIEMADIHELLVKLGELPPNGGNAATTRVIDAGDYQQALELLERLRHEAAEDGAQSTLVAAGGRTRNKSSRRRKSLDPRTSLCHRRRRPPCRNRWAPPCTSRSFAATGRPKRLATRRPRAVANPLHRQSRAPPRRSRPMKRRTPARRCRR